MPMVYMDCLYRDGLINRQEYEKALKGEVVYACGYWVASSARINFKNNE